jgi:hypothetical protein
MQATSTKDFLKVMSDLIKQMNILQIMSDDEVKTGIMDLQTMMTDGGRQNLTYAIQNLTDHSERRNSFFLFF